MSIPTVLHPTNRPNYTLVTIGDVTVCYSYQTPIAFSMHGRYYRRPNTWGPTTGKHFNEFCDLYNVEYSASDFEAQLSKVLGS